MDDTRSRESLLLVIERQKEQLQFWKEHSATQKKCLEFRDAEVKRLRHGLQQAQQAIFNAVK